MNTTEAAQLLAHCAAFDNRKPSAGASQAWAAALHDVPLDEDTLGAVARYYGTPEASEPGGKWIQPHHVKAHRQVIRADRLGPAGPGLSPTPPPADPADVKGYLAALRAQQAQVAAGRLPRETPALAAGKERDAYDGNPHVESLAAQLRARQDDARRRKAEAAMAERAALKAYRDAIEYLLNLDDHGDAAMDQARDELFCDEEAAEGFPLLAAETGVADQHKIAIRAARIAREVESEAS